MDFALKIVKYDDETVIRLQLWVRCLSLPLSLGRCEMCLSFSLSLSRQDIAGQERFGNMTRVYYKEAVGCFIVFDVTRGSTFEAVTKWKTDLDNKVQLPDGNPVPCVLLANKVNLTHSGEKQRSTVVVSIVVLVRLGEGRSGEQCSADGRVLSRERLHSMV